VTCTRTQEVLGQDYSQAKEVVSANKTKFPHDEAMNLIKDIDQIYSAKQNKVIHLDLKKQKPSKEEIAAIILGPTGNLRAPAIKTGKTLIVGFNKELLEEFISGSANRR